MPVFDTDQFRKIGPRAIELLDKAVMTAAEGALLALGTQHSEVLALDVFAVDWTQVGGYALGGAFLSIALNLARGGLTGRRGREVPEAHDVDFPDEP